MKLFSSIRIALVLAALSSAAFGQNLLSDPNFDAGFTGFTSSYTFVSSGTSQTEGTFGIRNFSQNYNSGYDAFFDHTTGSTGNMMLVDGALGPATIWSETVTVLPDTNYVFSAWATTADASNLPTLRFFINSVQIGTDLNLPTPAGNWQNFVNVWNSGSSTSAVISVMDTNTTSFGNDLALDDMSFVKQVPEPSSALMLLAGGTALGLRNRRRSREA